MFALKTNEILPKVGSGFQRATDYPPRQAPLVGIVNFMLRPTNALKSIEKHTILHF
jgi:hypothetical protein